MTIGFSDNIYKQFDQIGKDAVQLYFENNGYKYCDREEDRGIDLKFTKAGFPDIYAEAAVRDKFRWQLTDWDEKSPWKTIHVLERKMKYGKPEPHWYGDNAFLFEINHNCTEAFVIRPSRITVPKTQIKTTRGWEWMRDVPVNQFQLIKLI